MYIWNGKTKWLPDLFNLDIHINLGGFLMLYWNNNIDITFSAQDTFIWYAQYQNIWKSINLKPLRGRKPKSLNYLSLSKHQDRRIVRYYSIIVYSYSDVWWGIVPEWWCLVRRGHYTSPDNTLGKMFSREKTIICCTQHPILEIKEKHTQIQHYNSNNKIYNVTLYK